LWIVTDDQRPDSVSVYNRLVYGQDESPLGYVESPNLDRLASEGVFFSRAMCNSPGCGPSRGSMHAGRYPFRHGHYSFELTHQEPDFVRPTVPQFLKENGYATASFGKEDPYIYRWGPGQGYHDPGFYDHKIHNKHGLQRNDVGDVASLATFGKDGTGGIEVVFYSDDRKRSYFTSRKGEELREGDLAEIKKTTRSSTSCAPIPARATRYLSSEASTQSRPTTPQMRISRRR
jgi:arylsulfatase A-like enzyme